MIARWWSSAEPHSVGSNVDGLIAAGLFADLIAAPRSAALKTAAEPQTL